ncbi:glycosyltransferase [Sansalvadorimonas verongulae]|uniref:glycosyltransferase n=1 Tax=Sansalvadorimonas verongulae TaxID=2172824 RepID=UPI0012BC9F04|nr:glycosyltransferase [Sansalvadorimonas verongulae]MTI12167.1 hypothetical protein [Sansalvadorimonas verongulae]
MAHIALAWELGGGFGHLSRLKTLAGELLAAGHQITLIARHLEPAREVFSPLFQQFGRVGYVQAPFYNGHLPNSLEQTPAYVHVLFNVGYGDSEVLGRLVSNWHRLLCELKPDMLIADHSPTALMVSRDMAIPRINFGDGFTCPLPTYPLPTLHNALPRSVIENDEAHVLSDCNEALEAQGISPMKELADIYRVNETFLMTLRELDHLGSRPQVNYGGVLFPESVQFEHQKPVWPPVYGPKIFVYLKPREYLAAQLEVLEQTGLPVLACIPDVPFALVEKYANRPYVKLLHKPLNTGLALREAQLVVSHGGHQLTAECLMAGTPQIHLPLHLEQQLLAHRCRKTNCSRFAHPSELGLVLPQVLENLQNISHRAQQRAFQISRHQQKHSLGRCIALINYWLTG